MKNGRKLPARNHKPERKRKTVSLSTLVSKAEALLCGSQKLKLKLKLKI
jgi:hypothetical protein